MATRFLPLRLPYPLPWATLPLESLWWHRRVWWRPSYRPIPSLGFSCCRRERRLVLDRSSSDTKHVGQRCVPVFVLFRTPNPVFAYAWFSLFCIVVWRTRARIILVEAWVCWVDHARLAFTFPCVCAVWLLSLWNPNWSRLGDGNHGLHSLPHQLPVPPAGHSPLLHGWDARGETH